MPPCRGGGLAIYIKRTWLKRDVSQEAFSCEKCGKESTQKLILQHHMRTHTRIKQYICWYCGRGMLLLYFTSFLIASNHLCWWQRPHMIIWHLIFISSVKILFCTCNICITCLLDVWPYGNSCHCSVKTMFHTSDICVPSLQYELQYDDAMHCPSELLLHFLKLLDPLLATAWQLASHMTTSSRMWSLSQPIEIFCISNWSHKVKNVCHGVQL